MVRRREGTPLRRAGAHRGPGVVLVLALALPALATACVLPERRAYREAKRAYEECLEAHPGAPSACLDEEARLRDAERRYDEGAQRAWSCNPAVEECPERR